MLAGQPVLAADTASSAYQFSAPADTTTGSVYVTGTLSGVVFTAPTSGAVWLEWGGMLGTSSVTVGFRTIHSVYVKTGSTIGSGSDVLLPDDDRGGRAYKHHAAASSLYTQGHFKYALTGLTPGSDYNAYTVFRGTGLAGGEFAAVDQKWIAVYPFFG